MAADMGLMVETVRLSMGIEEARARVAAHNIAMANVPGSQAMQRETRTDYGPRTLAPLLPLLREAAAAAPEPVVWYLPIRATCLNVDFICKLHH